MKDRIEELRLKAKSSNGGDVSDTNPFDEDYDDGDQPFPQPQAVLFEEEPILENFLIEAQHIRESLNELSCEVKKFSEQQRSLVATMRRFSIMKKESSITRDIKLLAESLHKRLDKLNKDAQRSEAQLGPNSAVVRIQKAQHAVMFLHFQRVMCQYNDLLLSKQDKCKQFIRRQIEVSGRAVTESEVDEMMEQGKWDVFNENVILDAKITRQQLSEIEQRHKELINLESNMKDLRDLFLDIFMLVEEQGEYIERIQANVEKTEDYVQASSEKFKLAARYKKKNPLRRLLCCCCPWRCC